MLKWQYKPDRRSPSWQATIRVQRRDLVVLMADNPSLKSVTAPAIEQAYGNAVIQARAETGLPEATFPADCPWGFDEISDAEFWPGA
jgi:hypothetical protein